MNTKTKAAKADDSETSNADPAADSAAMMANSVEFMAGRMRSAADMNSAIAQYCQDFGQRQTALVQEAVSDLTGLAQECAAATDVSTFQDRQSAYAQRVLHHAVACNRLGVDWVAGMAQVVADANAKTKD